MPTFEDARDLPTIGDLKSVSCFEQSAFDGPHLADCRRLAGYFATPSIELGGLAAFLAIAPGVNNTVTNMLPALLPRV